MPNKKQPDIEKIFELMVKNDIETFEQDGIKITRKSLELLQEINRKDERINANVNKGLRNG